MKLYAVITGDIINFTKLPAEKRKSLVKESEQLLKGWIKKSADAEIFRGDSYQVLFDDVNAAIDKSIQLICWFKMKSDINSRVFLGTRISIGIGKLAYRGKNVLSSDGEAFHLSGRNFDQMKINELLVIKSSNIKNNKTIALLLMFINKIMNDWTLAQSEVIYLLIKGKTQQEIADQLSISQPSVNSRVKLSQWKDVEVGLNYISQLVQLDHGD